MNATLDYADGLKDVLIRKISVAEKKLVSLKLDYCRFVFGLSHRSKVIYDQVVYQVRYVDLDSMSRDEAGEWSKPVISGVRYEPNQVCSSTETINLSTHWEIYLG